MEVSLKWLNELWWCCYALQNLLGNWKRTREMSEQEKAYCKVLIICLEFLVRIFVGILLCIYSDNIAWVAPFFFFLTCWYFYIWKNSGHVRIISWLLWLALLGILHFRSTESSNCMRILWRLSRTTAYNSVPM